jgi:hypothetical protein
MLDLSGWHIGTECATAIGVGMQCTPNVQTLTIAFNDIGDEGAKAFGLAMQHALNLQTLRTLRALDFSNNSIGVAAAKANEQHTPNLKRFSWNDSELY